MARRARLLVAGAVAAYGTTLDVIDLLGRLV